MQAQITSAQLATLADIASRASIGHIVIHPYSGVVTASEEWTGRGTVAMIAPDGQITYLPAASELRA